ncbi:ADC synthase [Syncephalis plumigaleata]|nr:ADC synthase [Syncephalis plumigaleata]
MHLRILIIDNYDSYTLNLLQLLPEKDIQVVVIRNDQFTWEYLRDYMLDHFDGIILSPGPGTPEHPEDIGVVGNLLRHTTIPILGVCLGHQAIAYMAGSKIVHAATPVHGQAHFVHQVQSSCEYLNPLSLFNHIPSVFSVVRYHSLAVSETDLPECIRVLAYTINDQCHSSARVEDVPAHERTIMALQHRDKPFYGVQFHPESVCTEYGQQLMSNFLEITAVWHQQNSCITAVSTITSSSVTDPPSSLVTPIWKVYAQKLPYTTQSDRVFHTLFSRDNASVWLDSARDNDRQSRFSLMGSCQSTTGFKVEYRLNSKQIDLYRYTTTDIDKQTDTLASNDTFWDWTSRLMQQLQLHDSTSLNNGNLFEPQFDFCTGLVGYFGYEMKEEALPGYSRASSSSSSSSSVPDAAFLFLDRFISIDYATGATWLLGLVRHNTTSNLATAMKSTTTASMPLSDIGMSMSEYQHWTHDISNRLDMIYTPSTPTSFNTAINNAINVPEVKVANTCNDYIQKIKEAQSFIRDGESYELCLTTQLTCQLPQRIKHRIASDSSSDNTALTTLDFYRQLRHDNPAPYAAYINFGPHLCVASASPERFLRVSRSGAIQMRPIKGTLKRQRTCCCGNHCTTTTNVTSNEGYVQQMDPLCARERDAALARALATNVKERGENLMIVDLIRNDLARICSPHTVHVPQLMTVETYETVHQMVTTVDGQLKDSVDAVKALQSCFPPGSMTGAPKLRSVQLLEHLEDGRPRGIYSGCLGYLSINGSADFNVVIRTIVIQDGQAINIGAGGAITILSDPMEEWNEAITKADAVLPRYLLRYYYLQIDS